VASGAPRGPTLEIICVGSLDARVVV
jgi:hypothetical protein